MALQLAYAGDAIAPSTPHPRDGATPLHRVQDNRTFSHTWAFQLTMRRNQTVNQNHPSGAREPPDMGGPGTTG